MRRLAWIAIVLGSAAASAAGAQPVSLATADILNEAAFAPRVIQHDRYAPGVGEVRWTRAAAPLAPPSADGGVTSLRVSVGGDLRTANGLPPNLATAQFESRAYEVALIRDWPAALKFDANTFNVDLTPHAGVGLTNYGGSAEAGATVRISRDQRAAQKLRDLGISDGQAFGDRGRWYLYAAASGRAVGLNMLHGDGGWNRAGWSTDATSELVGDAQLGVGYRKGVMQSSLGYIHREVKGQHMIWGQQTRDDSMVAFSLTVRPQR